MKTPANTSTLHIPIKTPVDDFPLGKYLWSRCQTAQTTMLERTIELCEINSGSFNNQGISQVQDKLAKLFQPITNSYQTIDLPDTELTDAEGVIQTQTLRPMQVFRFNPEAECQLLLTGHSDTVFPVECSFQHCRIEGNHLHGPGTADMKGGLMVMLQSLSLLREILDDTFTGECPLGFTIAISPDEETGSLGSADTLTHLARQADFGLTFEPALSNGMLAGARKGSGNFTLCAYGKSVHAGREFFAGHNACLAIASVCQRLAALSDEESGITVNIGKISGGGAVNVVPDFAQCRFNARFKHQHQQATLEQSFREIIYQIEQQSFCKLKLSGQFSRPVKVMSQQQNKMYQLLRHCGEKLNIPIQWQATGGCCEGNNLAAAGLLNIDTLGVRGSGIHSDQEFACINSFAERSALVTSFMLHLLQQKLGSSNSEMERLLC